MYSLLFIFPIVKMDITGCIYSKLLYSILYKSEKTNIKINEYNVIKNTIEEETFNNEVLEEEVTQSYTASDGNTYEIVAKLTIPTLGIEYPVLSSASEELLKVSLNI